MRIVQVLPEPDALMWDAVLQSRGAGGPIPIQTVGFTILPCVLPMISKLSTAGISPSVSQTVRPVAAEDDWQSPHVQPPFVPVPMTMRYPNASVQIAQPSSTYPSPAESVRVPSEAEQRCPSAQAAVSKSVDATSTSGLPASPTASARSSGQTETGAGNNFTAGRTEESKSACFLVSGVVRL